MSCALLKTFAGGWWGGAFYPFTTSAYINTNHYKSAWEKNWTSIGDKKFWDGLNVPFYQIEGKYPALHSTNFTAIAVPLAVRNTFKIHIFLIRFKTQLFASEDRTVRQDRIIYVSKLFFVLSAFWLNNFIYVKF